MEVTEQSSDPPSTRPTVDFTMGGDKVTEDGVTVARGIELKDKVKNVGDGTITPLLLT
ncbi:hypothetical protein F2Q69_00061337 [Brassica cretica]|uniref:Uncharacterized protein n=1 Tax=Brassica cretica TaxID=69181 RepID=A0A8S9RDF6_BRACR|nr:hypothetical protein F2Q69_00061337 [Brassica cretica]